MNRIYFEQYKMFYESPSFGLIEIADLSVYCSNISESIKDTVLFNQREVQKLKKYLKKHFGQCNLEDELDILKEKYDE